MKTKSLEEKLKWNGKDVLHFPIGTGDSDINPIDISSGCQDSYELRLIQIVCNPFEHSKSFHKDINFSERELILILYKWILRTFDIKDASMLQEILCTCRMVVNCLIDRELEGKGQ